MVDPLDIGKVRLYGYVRCKLAAEGFHVRIMQIEICSEVVGIRENDHAPDLIATNISIGSIGWREDDRRLQSFRSIRQGRIRATGEDDFKVTIELLGSFKISVTKAKHIHTSANGVLMHYSPRKREGGIQ